MKALNPFFSIIIPVYNIEKYIERTILSILKNKFDDYEVIFINDGSTDNSLEIIKQYTNNSKLICVSQNTSGPSVARNYGLQLARGKYIFFIDGDDCITENALLTLYNKLEESDIDLLVFGRINNYEKKQIVPYQLSNEEFFSAESYFRTSLNNSTFRTNVWDKIFRRELIENYKLRFVNGLLYEDMFFLLQYLTYSKRISVISEPLYLYTLSNQTSITKILRKKDLDLLIFLDMAIQSVENSKVLSKKSCYTMLQRFSLSSILHKYSFYYKTEADAKKIIQILIQDYNFKKIVNYNIFHGLCLRDKLSACLLKINYRFYLFLFILLNS